MRDDELICPVCQDDEELTGSRDGDIIHITCARCGASWDRNLKPSCPECGETDLWVTAEAIWEKARGSQLSIVSVKPVYVCPDCEPERFEQVRQTNTPLPPPENPAAGMR